MTNIANRAKADLFLSVHINAGGDTGFERFIYNGNVSRSTRSFQNTLHSAVIKQIDVKDRGKKRANFAVVRQTKMPAVLTECLFIDTKSDANKLKDNKFLNQVAQGHADGILEFLGIKKGKNVQKSSKNSSAKKSYSKIRDKNSNQKYTALVDYLKDHGINSSFNNRKKLAQQQGIKNYTGTASQNIELLNKLQTGGKKKVNSAPKNSTNTKVNNTVKIKKSATRFATGETIASFAKGKSYKVVQEKSDRVLLDGIMSWVYKKDLEGYKSTNTSNSKSKKSSSYKVGQKVKIKITAKKYSRSSVNIPNKYKNKPLTIQQVGKDDVLLKELFSWVKKSDLR